MKKRNASSNSRILALPPATRRLERRFSRNQAVGLGSAPAPGAVGRALAPHLEAWNLPAVGCSRARVRSARGRAEPQPGALRAARGPWHRPFHRFSQKESTNEHTHDPHPHPISPGAHSDCPGFNPRRTCLFNRLRVVSLSFTNPITLFTTISPITNNSFNITNTVYLETKSNSTNWTFYKTNVTGGVTITNSFTLPKPQP